MEAGGRVSGPGCWVSGAGGQVSGSRVRVPDSRRELLRRLLTLEVERHPGIQLETLKLGTETRHLAPDYRFRRYALCRNFFQK
ncbi:MAG: hypothetical protein QOJ64_4237 [Acidobacteriota bacterium]|nr:hypothetical protein [Acidobacteriota bacterium]